MRLSAFTEIAMTDRLLPLSFMAVAIVVGPAHAAQVTPQAGMVSVNATGFAGAPPDITSTDSDSWTTAPTSLSAATSLALSSADGSILVGGAVAADWASEDAGQVRFSDFGWTRTGAGGWSLMTLDQYGIPAWSYTFVANADGGFRMTYDVVARGTDLRGLGGWQFHVDGGPACCGAYGAYTGADGAHVTGTLGAALIGGQTYTVSLVPFAYIRSTFSDTDAYMDGVFEWSISHDAVPEPGTWALMIAGFGLAGFALRRRSALA
jgi:hypothetical protein